MPVNKILIRKFRNLPRQIFLLSSFLVIALLLAFSIGCPPSSRGGQNSSDAASSDLPELSDEVIRDKINVAYVRDVPEENGAAEPINWAFNQNEPKEITVVEKQVEGTRATIVLDVKTRSAPYMRNPRSLAGQIRTIWALKTGWMMRKWEIIETENISMKYKNIPKPPTQNSNR